MITLSPVRHSWSTTFSEDSDLIILDLRRCRGAVGSILLWAVLLVYAYSLISFWRSISGEVATLLLPVLGALILLRLAGETITGQRCTFSKSAGQLRMECFLFGMRFISRTVRKEDIRRVGWEEFTMVRANLSDIGHRRAFRIFLVGRRPWQDVFLGPIQPVESAPALVSVYHAALGRVGGAPAARPRSRFILNRRAALLHLLLIGTMFACAGLDKILHRT